MAKDAAAAAARGGWRASSPSLRSLLLRSLLLLRLLLLLFLFVFEPLLLRRRLLLLLLPPLLLLLLLLLPRACGACPVERRARGARPSTQLRGAVLHSRRQWPSHVQKLHTRAAATGLVGQTDAACP